MKTPSETVQAAQTAFPHYFKALPPGCRHVDVYRVLKLFEVADPALQHAVKKLLCAGARGAKDQAQDVGEAIATLQRWRQMREEEQEAADLGAAVDQMREVMGRYCECRARLAGDCPGTWEPGCDMGSNEAHAASAPAEAGEQLDAALGMERNVANDVNELNELCDRLKAEREYLRRWEYAPAWATHLSEDYDGECRWYSGEPRLLDGQVWDGGGNFYWGSGYHKLGRVACEPRPRAEGER